MKNTPVAHLLSEEQRNNLRKLAYFHLGPGCVSELGFDMSRFQYRVDSRGRKVKRRPLTAFNSCGTAGCLLGHATLLGFKPLKGESWFGFSKRFFIPLDYSTPLGDAWGWCFDGEWADTDNTPDGGAKRILWTLEFGVPVNWQEQRDGKDPLCYADWNPEIPEAPKEIVPEQQAV